MKLLLSKSVFGLDFSFKMGKVPMSLKTRKKFFELHESIVDVGY